VVLTVALFARPAAGGVGGDQPEEGSPVVCAVQRTRHITVHVCALQFWQSTDMQSPADCTDCRDSPFFGVVSSRRAATGITQPPGRGPSPVPARAAVARAPPRAASSRPPEGGRP